MIWIIVLWGLVTIFIGGLNAEEVNCLFRDLELVKEIDQKISRTLPFFYNYSLLGGYFNMPSARMPKMGNVAIGFASVPPYYVFGANFQVLDRIELSANYRVYRDSIEKNFGHEGFGDDADRIGNVKFGILLPEEIASFLPRISYGLDDFIGTKRFNSQYVVATKELVNCGLELTLGWGKGRIHGFFGGAAWTPFYYTCVPFFKNLSILAEYDAIDYKKHAHEHCKGRSVRFRVNAGLSYILGDTLQVSVSSLRGKEVAGSISLRYPLGTTEGIFPKIDDPLSYHCPVDFEPLGVERPEYTFAHDLSYAFSDQGLDLYSLYLSYEDCQKVVWMKVVNNRYRDEKVVRERIEDLLAALSPCDVKKIIVVIQSAGVSSHQYVFRVEDLYRYRERKAGAHELKALSPMRDVNRCSLDIYEASLLFEREREIWTFTTYPQILTFFGSTRGKFKYSLGLASSLEGYLYKEVYYKLAVSYSAISSMKGLKSSDRLNPSKLLQVRTDSVKYYQTNTVSLEQAYFQRSWNLGKGWFTRFSAGYFEPAYAGGALEFLLYPVQSNWAIGVEAATLLKRRYHGFGFFRKISKFHDGVLEKKHYVGLQYFLDLYYDFKPLDLNFKVKIGQFLAKDIGARFEVTRCFASGLRFSLWVTVTNGHDKVNGKTYFDKGFAFSLPFDIFLKQSSRQRFSFGMSAWLRDVGAIAETGNTLYETLYEERFD